MSTDFVQHTNADQIGCTKVPGSSARRSSQPETVQLQEVGGAAESGPRGLALVISGRVLILHCKHH